MDSELSKLFDKIFEHIDEAYRDLQWQTEQLMDEYKSIIDERDNEIEKLNSALDKLEDQIE